MECRNELQTSNIFYERAEVWLVPWAGMILRSGPGVIMFNISDAIGSH